MNIKPISAALIALCLASAVQAADLSPADRDAAKAQIKHNYDTAKATCDQLSGNAEDICEAQAKADKKVGEAELKYGYNSSPSDLRKLNDARAEAAYDVAKEKCDDLSGNPKDVCVKEAKAAMVKAKANDKATEAVGEARQEAAKEKLDAAHAVAKEKCDALSGDAKSDCLAKAKVQYQH